MNLYFLVEDSGSGKKIYESWIKLYFPNIAKVDASHLVRENNCVVVSGKGYPSYLNRIPESLQDITEHGGFDHFFICIDTEEMSCEEKKMEIESLLISAPSFNNTHIILHHCCIETWFLGHAKMMKSQPEGETLRRFKNFYDVSIRDPELMPTFDGYHVRAQFHFKYFQEMCREHHGVYYSKASCGVVFERHFLEELKDRIRRTNHLGSFSGFVEILSRLQTSNITS